MTEASSSRNPFHRSPGRRQGVRALLPVGVVAVVAAGTALAPSLASASPALPAISAQALLTKLATSKVQAYSGTVNVTTNLGLPALPDLGGGANPMSLLSGTHVVQVAVNGPDKQRIGLLDRASEYDLIHNGQQLWIYDSDQNAVEQGTLPAKPGRGNGAQDQGRSPLGKVPLTPAQAVQQIIAAVTPTTGLAVAGNQSVAGQAAYTLVVTPKVSGSLISRVEIAVDAQNGAPLSFAIYSSNAPATPVFQIAFTSVSFAAPADSRFEFTAPAGAKVSPLTGDGADQGRKPAGGDKPTDPQQLGQNWLSVLELHGVDVTGGLNQFDQPGKPGGSDHTGQGSQQGSQKPQDSQSPNGLFNGDVGSYLQALGNAGTKVTGAFGSGTLYTTNFVTVLATDDGRVFLGAVTPSVLEADADAQGSR